MYPSLKELFDLEGFVHVGRFMTDSELNEIEENLTRFLRDVLPCLSKTDAMYEDYNKPSTLKQIGAMTVDPFFSELPGRPKMVGLAETLLGDSVMPRGLQFFNKPPGIGKSTPPHQDGYYFSLVPNEAVTLWIPLDNVDEENGALHYIKGSHKKGVLPHGRTEVLGFSQGLLDGVEGLGEEVTCYARRGDCLAHHSLMVHSAGANRSRGRSRRAFGLVYYARRARVDEEAHRRYYRCA